MSFIRKMITDIREKTADMGRAEKAGYIFTYYWYHMLGAAAVIACILIFGGHFLFGQKKPAFTCVMVNQMTDDARDDRLAEDFAVWSGRSADSILIDSNYIFSYEGYSLEGANESYYDKFFLKWGNAELDAVIIEEDFYQFCKKMRGRFQSLEEYDTGTLPLYEDDGAATAIVLENQKRIAPLDQDRRGKLLLAFPGSGSHKEACQQFIDFIATGVLGSSVPYGTAGFKPDVHSHYNTDRRGSKC